MRKKLLSLLLVLCMVLTLAPAALAAENIATAPPTTASDDEGVRETDFFTDNPHSDVNWTDMEYTPVTEEAFLAAVDEVKTLMESSASASEVLEKFHVVSDMYLTIRTNASLINIKMSIDSTDKTLPELYKSEVALFNKTIDVFLFLVKDILNSSYKDAFVQQEKLTEDDIESYLAYGGTTDEQKALNEQISVLENSYDTVSDAAYTDLNMDMESAYEAAVAGEITPEQYYAVVDARYQALGELYMQILDLNTQLAATYDYDNYYEFANFEEYGRDYTAEEVDAFSKAIGEYLLPLYSDLAVVFQDSINKVFYESPLLYNYYWSDVFANDEHLMSIRPYIGRMSSEMLEAYDYMLAHGLYDIKASAVKGEGGFTTILPLYGAPFFFDHPAEGYPDFSTIIHEFGHYDNFYWHPCGWNDGSSDIDVAEVHSQALEMLFIQFYPEIFETDTIVKFFTESTVYRLIRSGIIEGALIGGLEAYASSTEDVTLDQICDKYAELLLEYGMVEDEEEAQEEKYGWLDIPHVITSPMYYISYATSGMGAFSFWLEAQTDGYEAATDHYLEFVSQSVYTPFLEQFENAGMENPLSPEYVKAVVDTIYDILDIEENLNPAPTFQDILPDNPYYTLIEYAHKIGAVNGDGTGSFNPSSKTTRAEVIQAFYNVFERYTEVELPETSVFSDVTDQWYADAANWAAACGIINGEVEDGKVVFNGNGEVTREMMATIVYRIVVNIAGADPSYSAAYEYTDAGSISPWAYDAVMWLTEQTVLSPVDEVGNILPQGIMNRLNLASYAYNLFILIFG